MLFPQHNQLLITCLIIECLLLHPFVFHNRQISNSVQDQILHLEVPNTHVLNVDFSYARNLVFHKLLALDNSALFGRRYRRHWFKVTLPISFQFHHAQMDGGHAVRFLNNLQAEIKLL
ncbi:MAG: hypothetical protein IKQ05_03110 [Prevotella sp.]|nr:hypothetical protein [Prevotella sp.]